MLDAATKNQADIPDAFLGGNATVTALQVLLMIFNTTFLSSQEEVGVEHSVVKKL